MPMSARSRKRSWNSTWPHSAWWQRRPKTEPETSRLMEILPPGRRHGAGRFRVRGWSALAGREPCGRELDGAPVGIGGARTGADGVGVIERDGEATTLVNGRGGNVEGELPGLARRDDKFAQWLAIGRDQNMLPVGTGQGDGGEFQRQRQIQRLADMELQLGALADGMDA